VLAQINAERGNLLDAESGFFFAISLEPNEATPHHWYSLLLSRVGRLNLALDQARKAQELDPTSPVLAANLAGMYLMLGEDEQALRFSTLAADLGLSKKQGGIESAVAMRRGQWDEARRLIAAQENIPPEVRPQAKRYVDAVENPGLRSAVIAEMLAIDPKIMPPIGLIQPLLHLGAIDAVYETIFAALDEDPASWVKRWDLNHAWGPEGEAFRKDPRFAELARRIGIVEYWKQYGFPDGCSAGQDTPIVCT
jgi:tetratricopeptide (TPR) repeat protein